ncbi:MAG: GRP family sugar transporter [Candidatus Paceibacterota bacterium]
MIGLALAAGIIYLFSTNLRMDSFRYIDTTIALPIHKFFSPLFVLLFGVILFKENLTTIEFIGIILGVLIPLLLINQTENGRQQNLKQGVLLITLSALLSGVGAVIYKLVTDLFSAVLFFAGIANIILALASIFFHKSRGVIKDTKTMSLNSDLIKLVFISGFVQMISFSTLILSFAYSGSLAIVYTITSLYIIIPIVLSIIFYNEHWNTRKVVAIVLSILAVVLMGVV